jgi:hypothetical protein
MSKDIHKTEPQTDRFRGVARELDCDEGGAALKEKVALIGRQKPTKQGRVPPDDQQTAASEDPAITVLPARRAKGALSVVKWSSSRAGMRDKAQRTGENKRQATKQITKPIAPGTKR